MKKALFVGGICAAIVLLFLGCEMLQFEKALTIELGDFELEAEETPLTRMMGSKSSNTMCSPVAEHFKQERIEKVPDYVKDIQIDSISIIITNLDSTNDVTLSLYLSEEDMESELLDSLAVKIGEAHLEPDEQITIDGSNFNDYFFNLDLAAEILKDGQFWYHLFAESDGTYLHVTGEDYTLYVTVIASIF